MIKHYTHNLLAKIAKSVFLLAIIGLSLTKANAQLSGGSTYTINGTNNYPTTFATFGGFVNYLNTAGTTGSGQIIVEITSSQIDSVIPVMSYLGDVTRPILFKPASGNTVTITTTTVTSPAANTSLFRMNGTKYFTIDGSNNGTTSKDLTWLVPSANGVTTNSIIGLAGATDSCVQDTIKNCIFIGGKGGVANATAGIYTFAGVYSGGAATTPSAGVANNNRCAVINNTFYGVRNGIVIRGNATLANRANGWTIANNIIGGTNTWEMFGANNVSATGAGGSSAIILSSAVNCRITGNNIGNTFYSVFGDLRGIELGTTGNYCSNISIDANKIYNLNYTGTGGYGPYGIFVNMGTQTASNIAIANNMISGLKGDAWSSINSTDNVYGIRLTGTSSAAGVYMYHNSISLYGNTLGSSTTNAFAIGVLINSGITGGVEFKNNIIRNTMGRRPAAASGTTTIMGLVSTYASTSATCFSAISNNSYYLSSTAPSTTVIYGFVKNANQSTYANLTAATGEANSVNVNPTFADSNDLHLNYGPTTATLLESGGTTIGGLNFDFDNQVRPGPTAVNGGGTLPDIGADERDMKPLIAPSVGVSAILSPASSTNCGGSSTVTITVRVKNFSNTNAVDCSTDSFNVKMAVTGPNAQNFTLVKNSGTIAANSTFDTTFTTTYNMSAVGTYNFKGYTDLSTDFDRSNDTSTSSSTVLPIISTFPYNEGFESNNGSWTSSNIATANSWVYGTPAKTIITGAYQGTKCWIVGGTGSGTQYVNSEISALTSPCLDFTSLASPSFSFYANVNTETGWDAMVVETSTNGGASWQRLDSANVGLNYNSTSTSGPIAPPKFSGTIGWTKYTFDLASFAGNSNVKIRFRFGADGSGLAEGVAIDNLQIKDPSSVDMKALRLSAPTSSFFGTNKTIKVRFQNKGTATIDFSTNNLVVNSSVSGPNSATFGTVTVSSGTLAVNDSVEVTVSTTCNLSTAGAYTFSFKCSATGDGDNLNDSTGKVVNVVQPLDYSIARTTNVAFNSIMGSGNSFGFSSTNGDDQTSSAIAMPFTFNYQGQNVASFRACTNGWMTLNGASVTSNSWTNAITANTTTQNAILAPLWDDLVCTGYQAPAYYSSASQLDQSLKYLVTGTSPNRILTVEWAGMEKFTYPGPNMNFQVKLYENGSKIQYIYGNMGAFDGTSIGEYSYSVGMNSFTTTTAVVDEVLSLQQANSTVFSETAKNNLSMAPSCYTMYEFTSGTHGSGTVTPAITNDESTGALTLSIDTDAPVEYCTVNRTEGATNSGIAASSGDPDDDVWFTFTLGSAKAVQFDLRSSPSFDGVFQVFDNSLTQVTPCVNKTGLSLTEDTIVTLSAGTYYVRVFHSGVGSGNTVTSLGDFALFAYDAPIAPVNDNMNGMILLNSNTTCVLSSTQRTTFANGSSQTVCTGTASKDIWYYFQAGYSSHTVTVTPVAPGTTFNPVVQIFNLGATADTTNAISGNQVACQNNTGTNASEAVSLTTLVPGNFYAVRVYHFLGGAGGTGRFKICVANPVGFWSGSSNSTWPLASNWSNGVVPTSATNVRIGAGRSNYPIISSVVSCNNLIVDTTASLTINNGGNLQVNGTLTAPTSNFTFTHNSGWLTLNAATNLPAWNYFALRLNANSGTYTMQGNTTVNDYFVNNGAATLATAGFTLTCKKDITNNGVINGSGKILSQRSVGYSTFTGTSTGTYENVEIDAISGVARFAQNMQINGTLTLTSGLLVINPAITITVGTTSSSTGNVITGATSSILAANSATTSTFALLGNASAPQVTNFKFSSNGSFTLNRPNGVSLGANSTIGSILTLTSGTIEQNGFNLNIGSTGLSTVAVNRTNGKVKNSLNTGTLSILGNASAANVSTLNLDTVNSILINIPNGFTVDSLFYVKSLASITKGFVNLNGATITLGTNATVNEAANQTFRGTTGSITTTRNFATALSNNNVAGLGLKLSTNAAPGTTTITRKHNVYTSFSGSSIKRNFNVTSSNSVTATVFVMAYDSTELSGADRGKLRFNMSTNSGASWSNITGCTPTTANTTTGYVTRNGVVVLNSTATIYTLSDSANTPLSPVFTNNTSISNSYSNQINGVYPNPFINELTIDFVSEVNGLSTVRMTDINGKVVYNGNFATQQGQNLMNIDGASFASGVYLITLMNNNEVKTIRVIKQ